MLLLKFLHVFLENLIKGFNWLYTNEEREVSGTNNAWVMLYWHTVPIEIRYLPVNFVRMKLCFTIGAQHF